MSEQVPDTPRIFSIGHSNHDLETFIGLLRRHAIEVLVDVRSRPYSRYTPHFSQAPLKEAVAAAGFKYLFLGRELGGRPDGDEFYDAEGRVYYDRVARSPLFLGGIGRLEDGADRYRVAMLCAEEDPAGCHRRLLVGRVLDGRGVRVLHIRGDGSIQPEADLLAEEERRASGDQLSLFGVAEVRVWKSLHPIRTAPEQQPG